MRNKISVISINLNNTDGLKSTIESIRNQNVQPFEYIVIDGGSNDDLTDLINENSEFITKYISENDNGIYDAMNKGASICNGEWIAFLNSGDIYYPNVVEELSISLKESKFDFTIGSVDIFNNCGDKIFTKYPLLNKNGLLKLTEMPAAHLSIFVRKQLFESLGGFNQDFSISADYDFVSRMYKKTQNIYTFKNKVGRFFLGGISGNPKRFIEDFKILRSNQVNLFSALFITIKKYFGYALGFIIPKRLKQFRFRLLSK
tara:strand:+ start:19229 stop:20005 length:777 start_codon:yes stop_codon:yes gene_type:complete